MHHHAKKGPRGGDPQKPFQNLPAVDDRGGASSKTKSPQTQRNNGRARAARYQASPIKRARSTKAEVEQRRRDLYGIVRTMKPMTVRQVFYRATVLGIVEKSEAGYTKVQTDLVKMRRAGELPYDWLADNTRWQRRTLTLTLKSGSRRMPSPE